MKKKEFEKELNNRLKNLSEQDCQKAMSFYDELYFDKLERGLSEEDAIKSFGEPEEIAARIITESYESAGTQHSEQPYNPYAQNAPVASAPSTQSASNNQSASVFSKTAEKVKIAAKSIFTNKTFLIVYFSLFFITIPLTIALLSVAFGILVAALGIFVAFAVSGFAMAIAGPAVAIIGIIKQSRIDGVSLAYIGAGLAILAIGILLIKCLRFFDWLRILIFVKQENKDKALEKIRKKKILRPLIIILAIVIAGGSVFSVGMTKLDWDFKRLDTTVYTSISQTLDDPFNKVVINTASRNVEVIGVTENYRIDAYKYVRSDVEISVSNGVLTVKENWKFDIRDGIFNFGFLNHQKRTIYIYVPEQLTDVEVELSSGEVLIDNIDVDNKIQASGTSGDITIKNSTANESNITVTSGDIEINNCVIAEVKANVTSGKINAYRLTSDAVDLRVTSGKATLQIKGSRADFNITSQVLSGNNQVGTNLNASSEKKIHMQATSGKIIVSFFL